MLKVSSDKPAKKCCAFRQFLNLFINCYILLVYKGCGSFKPLGMADNRIQSSQLNASSSKLAFPFAMARLNLTNGMCWKPEYNDATPWFEVNFVIATTISGVLMQGQHFGNNLSFVTQYHMSYSNDGVIF